MLVEQRELAEVRAGTKGGDQRAVTLDRRGTVDDHHELPSDLALAHQHPTGLDGDGIGPRVDRRELGVAALREERQRAERGEEIGRSAHGRTLSRGVTMVKLFAFLYR